MKGINVQKLTHTLRRLDELTHAVEVSGGVRWETIAAFNSERVAENYARECGENIRKSQDVGLRNFKYRVRPL